MVEQKLIMSSRNRATDSVWRILAAGEAAKKRLKYINR